MDNSHNVFFIQVKSMSKENLEKIWNETCKELKIIKWQEHVIFSILNHHYSLPERAYHNWDHIEFCLKKWNGLKEVKDKKFECVGKKFLKSTGNMAYFFHDFIYNFENPENNERDSALFSDNLLSWTGVDKNNIVTINYLIGLTNPKTYIGKYAGQLQKKFRDIDYLSLAGEWGDVKSCEIKIRLENNFLPTEEYREKRVAFLKSLLEGKTIFLSDDFVLEYEERARDNIEGLISLLENAN